MSFTIRMGVPEMQEFWDDMRTRANTNNLDKAESKLWKKLAKTVLFLSSNPRHNSLESHEIDDLTRRYTKIVGQAYRVWQSYLENQNPGSWKVILGRLNSGKGEITVIGLDSHPEDQKKSGYAKVNLSGLPLL